ncbi:O-antigen ligase family protein [Anaerohalosphaeraceae bacterium U12dextr]
MALKKNNLTKPASNRLLEGILLAVVLGMMALRLSFVEQPHSAMQNPALWTTPRGMSLLLSGVVFAAVMAGVVSLWIRGRLPWSGRLVPLATGLFLVGGVIACMVSSDKRAAISELFTLIVPMLMAITVVGWLDSQRRVDAAVWVILATGCAAVYVSMDQYTAGNSQVEQDYAADPYKHLALLGIEPNSLAHFQYEHRLHSKDVRGFLLTSNSTATFLLAGILISLGLIVDTLRSRREDAGFAARLVVQLVVLMTLAVGLLIGKSRGGIGAAMLSGGLFAVFLLCRRWVWAYRKPIFIAGLLAAVVCGSWVIAYGHQHGRLPGPNALYVRWQYWVGAAEMLKDRFVTGVGGGNFGIFYPRYKIAAAPETVKDPHQFILSLWCQFGILGPMAFLMAVGAVVWKGFRRCCGEQAGAADSIAAGPDALTPWGVLMGTLFLLLVIRPWVSEGGIIGENATVQLSVFVLMYVLPAAAFVLAFGLLWATAKEPTSVMPRDGLLCGLVCGVVGILIHNLIDFAIFEPGVWMSFWLMLALILAISRRPDKPAASEAMRMPRRWIGIITAVLVTGLIGYHYVWIPVKAGAVFQRGLRDFDHAEPYFLESARLDPLDPDPWVFAGQWHLSQYENTRLFRREHAEKAVSYFQQACGRDRANFRCRELLGRAYIALAETNPQQSGPLLESAYQAGLEAQARYPGSDRIAYDLGLLAERMGNRQEAFRQFSQAVLIEEQYRAQFARMYPGYPLCSRLGQSRYDYALAYVNKERVSPETPTNTQEKENTP